MKVRIKSADASFRRAGLQFTREGVVVDSESLTDEQREAITMEPRLSVEPVEDQSDNGTGGTDQGGTDQGGSQAAGSDKKGSAKKGGK